MNFAKIDSAIVKAWIACGQFQDGTTQYENKDFTPPAKKAWARLTNIRSQPTPVTIGECGYDEHLGFLQVDMFFPLNSGKGPSMQMADTIARFFKPGQSFDHETQCVLITSCGCSDSRNEGGWYRTIITINWSAQVQR